MIKFIRNVLKCWPVFVGINVSTNLLHKSFNPGQLAISMALIKNHSWTKGPREKEMPKAIYHQTVSIQGSNPNKTKYLKLLNNRSDIVWGVSELLAQDLLSHEIYFVMGWYSTNQIITSWSMLHISIFVLCVSSYWNLSMHICGSELSHHWLR